MENGIPVLKGSNVLLRDMMAEDQPLFRQWLTDNEELRRLIDSPSIPTTEDQEAWFERAQKTDRKFFSIITLPDNALIGNAGFVDIDPQMGSAQFRITIGDTSYHGKGLGSEVMELLLRYAFEDMRLVRVWLRVIPDNVAAVRLYEKAGFMPVGDPDQKGRVEMQLEREDFLRRHVV